MQIAMEKLIQANQLIVEAEEELIETVKFCPYEVGNALRSLDEAINKLQALQKNH